MPRYGTEYTTNNLFEVAFINYKGFKPKAFLDEETGKSEFSFLDPEGLIEDLLEEFWNSSDELRLLETFRTVKRTAVGDKYRRGYYRSVDEQNCDRLPSR